MNEVVVAFVDKTIVRITGLQVKGLKPFELEDKLSQYIGRPVRLIGATGDSLQMDVYGLEPEAVLRDARGIIEAISAVPGLTALEVAGIASAKKARAVSAEELAAMPKTACAKERWLPLK